MTLDIVLLLITCLTNLTLGALVMSRNPHSNTSRAFLGITGFTTVWAIANYLTNIHHVIIINDVANRVTYLAAFGAVLSGVIFSNYFPARKKVYLTERILLEALSGLALLLSPTSLVAGHVTEINGVLTFKPGPLVAFYAISLMVFVSVMTKNFLRHVKKAHGAIRQQALLIMIGFGLTVALGVVANVLLPLWTDSAESTRFGPSLSIILVGAISYAIIRHKLFDIRLVIARSLGYLLSLLLLAGLYGVVVFGAVQLLFDVKVSLVSQIFLALLAGLLSLAFQPLHKAFDKWTSRIFYKDAYDPQEVLDALSNRMVGAINVAEILAESKKILQQAIRTNDFTFWLVSDHPFKVTKALDTVFRSAEGNTVAIDDVEGHAQIVAELKAQNIIVAVRLRTGHDELGYITLGYKESGDIYNQRDKRLLGIAADEIAITLQNALHFEEIQNFNLTLQQKITDATKQLRNTNQRLKQLDETKDDFISMASHQLRTPLTSVKGYISMVLEGDAGKITPLQEQMLNQAFISSQRMVFLIADLLNVSRLKTGKFIIMPSETDLSTLITEESEQLRETAEARQVAIKYEPPKNFPKVMVDETKTRQVIMNFMDNAIYYTRPGGAVTITLTETPENIELRIKDNGIGVPKAEQHHLFTKFYRANNARQVRPDGTGLGLFMARKVIVAQGGTIIFESQEGKGSTFGFSLNKKAVLVSGANRKAPTEAVTIR